MWEKLSDFFYIWKKDGVIWFTFYKGRISSSYKIFEAETIEGLDMEKVLKEQALEYLTKEGKKKARKKNYCFVYETSANKWLVKRGGDFGLSEEPEEISVFSLSALKKLPYYLFDWCVVYG